MTSLILRTAARFLMPLMLMFSIFLLIRGHHQPGGGFSGGLVAAAAFALYLLSHDAASARRILGVSPQIVIGAGLLCAAAAGIAAWFSADVFLTGYWTYLPFSEKVFWGTPLLFDLGVYLVSFGSTLLTILALWET